MSNNEYNDLDKFIREYEGNYSKDHETYIGIEFEYKDIHYRMSREPNDGDKFYLIKVSKVDRNKVEVLDNLNFKVISIFQNLNDLLNSKIIDNRKFSDIIIDSNTVILSKD